MSDHAFDPREYRQVLAAYPTGVCVITAKSASGGPVGFVVGSFTSISLDPPLVGFFPDKHSSTWPEIEQVGRFCVNVLGADQHDLCRRFSARGGDKFAELSHGASPAGQPLLDDAIAWVDCVIDRVFEIGDHWFVVGAVEALGSRHDRTPLLFFRGGYHDAVELKLD